MNRNLMVITGIIMILGLLTLGFALFLSFVAPNLMYTYMTAHSSSFSHDYMYPIAIPFYVLSVVEIVAGIVGVRKYGMSDSK